MNINRHNFNFLFLFILASFFFSCSGNDDNTENGKGFAIEKVDGHSFQFYNSKQLVFSVLIKQNDIKVAIGEGKVLSGAPTFTYEKTGDNTATCLIFIPFSYILGGNTIYNVYSSYTKLTFNSSQGGNYQNYDIETNKAGSSGLFTIDNNNPDFTETPKEPENPEGQPGSTTISKDAIISKITKLFDGATEDQVLVNYTYDPSIVNKVKSMGHCWNTKPNPTVQNSTVKNILSSNKNTGTATCHIKHAPGTTYYFRAFAQVGTEFIYFNEIKIETLGGILKLSTNYSKKDDKIYIDYDIQKNGTFELLFECDKGNAGISDESLGYLSKGKGQKSVEGLYHDFTMQVSGYYYAILKEISTEITYCSRRITNYSN